MQNTSAITTRCPGTVLNGSERIRTAIAPHDMAIGSKEDNDQTPGNVTRPQGNSPDGTQPCHKKPTRIMEEIPLYLIPAALTRCTRENGPKVYRVVIARSHWHHYTIKVRCSTKKAIGQFDPANKKTAATTICPGAEVAHDD